MKRPFIKKSIAENFSETLPSENTRLKKQEPARGSQSRKSFIGKIHNNLQQFLEKYKSLAQAAMGQGDRVLAETYYQYAEHAIRLSNQDEEDHH